MPICSWHHCESNLFSSLMKKLCFVLPGTGYMRRQNLVRSGQSVWSSRHCSFPLFSGWPASSGAISQEEDSWLKLGLGNAKQEQSYTGRFITELLSPSFAKSAIKSAPTSRPPSLGDVIGGAANTGMRSLVWTLCASSSQTGNNYFCTENALLTISKHHTGEKLAAVRTYSPGPDQPRESWNAFSGKRRLKISSEEEKAVEEVWV